MKRIGMTLAAAAVVGGVLLTAGQAGACEGHHARKAEAVPAPVEPGEQESAARTEQAPVPAKKDGQGEVHAAKCGCGSAADCTCKKGTCECPKCKKRHEDVVPTLEAEGRAQEPREVRLDASAGVFI